MIKLPKVKFNNWMMIYFSQLAYKKKNLVGNLTITFQYCFIDFILTVIFWHVLITSFLYFSRVLAICSRLFPRPVPSLPLLDVLHSSHDQYCPRKLSNSWKNGSTPTYTTRTQTQQPYSTFLSRATSERHRSRNGLPINVAVHTTPAHVL